MIKENKQQEGEAAYQWTKSVVRSQLFKGVQKTVAWSSLP